MNVIGRFDYARAKLERVVKVRAVEPGFTFRAEGVRAFGELHFLTVHIGNADVHGRIFIKRVGGTGAQPQTILIRDGDRAVRSRNRAIIEGDTGTQGSVLVHIVGGL